MPENPSSRRRNSVFERPVDSLAVAPIHGETTNTLLRFLGDTRWSLKVEPLQKLLLDGHPAVFKDIPNRPSELDLLRVKPEMIVALGRPDRRLMMTILESEKVTITLQEMSERNTAPRNGTRRMRELKEEPEVKECNLAIATIIAIAFLPKVNKEQKAMVSELLGLSTPATMELFREPFCHAPFIALQDVPNFVHVVARSVAHEDRGGTYKSLAKLRAAAEIVADILQNLNKSDSQQSRGMRQKVKEMMGRKDVSGPVPWSNDADLFKVCIREWSEDIDRGIQVGLVLAGMRKYFERIKDDLDRNYAVALGLADGLLAGLTGVPVGGFVFGIAQSVVSRVGAARADRSLEKVAQKFAAVLDAYYEYVELPLRRTGKLEIDGSNFDVNADVFCTWVNLTMKYNDLPQI